MKHTIIIFNEKHGRRYFYLPSDEYYRHKETVFTKIFNERVSEGYWYHTEDMSSTMKRKYLSALNGDKADIYSFMHMRCSYEYENFEIVDVEEVL